MLGILPAVTAACRGHHALSCIGTQAVQLDITGMLFANPAHLGACGGITAIAWPAGIAEATPTMRSARPLSFGRFEGFQGVVDMRALCLPVTKIMRQRSTRSPQRRRDNGRHPWVGASLLGGRGALFRYLLLLAIGGFCAGCAGVEVQTVSEDYVSDGAVTC